VSTTETISTPPPAKRTLEPLVRLEGVKKHFPITRGIIFQRKVGAVHAVDGVDLEIFPGETLGLVGETGCGKSTLARVVMRLHTLTEGKLWFDGRDVTNIKGRELRDLRRDMQMVFQDPYASLNPRKTVGSIIGAPFRLHGTIPKNRVKGEVQELMELVGLNPEHYNRYPHEFSGGQRQRIGVARSLALRPKLIVCDEPVSALDVSIQAQILNLLEDLQNEFNLTYLFIAHDLSVVKHVSDRVSVMYLGQIVETAERDSLYAQPRHPYTGALMSAVPVPDPKLAKAKRRIILEGDVPSPIDPPSGCRFHPRCPRTQALAKEQDLKDEYGASLRFVPRCHDEEPLLTDQGPGHVAACHFPLDVRIIPMDLDSEETGASP
jgi:oligopeptide/dipeptide ABC transporter ATP-binding protein